MNDKGTGSVKKSIEHYGAGKNALRNEAIKNLKSGNTTSTRDKIKALDVPKKKSKSLGRSTEKEMLDSMNSMRPNNEDMYEGEGKDKK